MFAKLRRLFLHQATNFGSAPVQNSLGTARDGDPQVPSKKRRSWRRLAIRAGLALLLLISVGAVGLHLSLRASLPQLDGSLAVRGITDTVELTRDFNGNPTVEAQSYVDLAFGVGFAHAQDRLFQMDALRRVSSGRLSELFGEPAFPVDRHHRKHRFQQVAKQVVERASDETKQLLNSYTAGVNAAIANMQAAPFEYLVLNAVPEPWQNEDCVYVLLTMFCDVQDEDGARERNFGKLHESVPEEVFQFFVRTGSSWDAAIDESSIPPPPIPPASVWTLRDQNAADSNGGNVETTGKISPDWVPEGKGASNNWAVSGELTETGHAMLASDMHLRLGVPCIWYRIAMNWVDDSGATRRLVGFTLPGIPHAVEGSNGSIAWGLTNSQCDSGDIVELKMDERSADSYVTPDGPRQLERFTEQISIGGSRTRSIDYEWSIWGPVVENRDGRRFVHRWTGHDPEAVNFDAFDLAHANTAEEALLVANRMGVPPLNFVVADSQGSIGWTLAGLLPRRAAPASQIPVDWSEGNLAWDGYMRPEEYPRILNPNGGRIWTANSRVVGGEMLVPLGDGGYLPGARASQIRDRLSEKERFTEADMLAIQLDDEARFLQRWQQLLLRVLDAKPDTTSSALREFVDNWGGHASVDSVGYRIVREFRVQVIDYLFGLTASHVGLGSSKSRVEQGAFQAKTGVTGGMPLAFEDVTWELLKAQPENFLPPAFQTWDDFLGAMVVATENYLSSEAPTSTKSLSNASWGAVNTSAIDHPMSANLPFLSSFLNMPKTPLPGDDFMPRVQSINYGSSQRMVVTPGYEEQGIYHQPGGPSGNPYSPFYRAGFEDWTSGEASPLLPGKAVHRLTLNPKEANRLSD